MAFSSSVKYFVRHLGGASRSKRVGHDAVDGGIAQDGERVCVIGPTKTICDRVTQGCRCVCGRRSSRRVVTHVAVDLVHGVIADLDEIDFDRRRHLHSGQGASAASDCLSKSTPGFATGPEPVHDRQSVMHQA